MNKKVTIGITTHNCLNATKMTLETLFANTIGKFNLLVIDNDSKDGTLQYLEDFRKRVGGCQYDYVPLGMNFGCARSFNEIFKRTMSDDYVILANNDVSWSKNWLTNLIKYMDEHPEIGICSPFPVDNHISDETKLKWFGDIKNYNSAGVVDDEWFRYAENIETNEKDISIDGIHGCVMGYRREQIDSVGLFDENFIQGCYEDCDIVIRTEKAGFLCKTTHSSVIYHAGGTTQHLVCTREGDGYRQRNRRYFEQKYNISLDGLVCCRGMLWDNSIPRVNTRIIV